MKKLLSPSLMVAMAAVVANVVVIAVYVIVVTEVKWWL